jgi:alkylhydroperoxidase/carboxymuconolactone decarboxylase family protein YurZ
MEGADAIKQEHLEEFRLKTGWTAPNDHPRTGRRPQTPQSVQDRRLDVLWFLRTGIEMRYAKATSLAESIQDVLFIPEKGDLEPDDRQRCLITILATRPEQFPLAIHTYIGLMEGIAIEEMRNIFFLVGVYSGVPGMVNGIDVLERVLGIINDHKADAAQGKEFQKTILGRLKEQFSPGISKPLPIEALKNVAPQRDKKLLGVRETLLEGAMKSDSAALTARQRKPEKSGSSRTG